MAISSRYTFDYRVRLRRGTDGVLEGRAEVDPSRPTRTPGALGHHPSVRIDGDGVHLVADLSERPRWWRIGGQRLQAATTSEARWKIDRPLLDRVVREGDELLLSYDLACVSSLAVLRDGQGVLAFGGGQVLAHFGLSLALNSNGTGSVLGPDGHAELGQSVDIGRLRVVSHGRKADSRWGVIHLDLGLPAEILADFPACPTERGFALTLWSREGRWIRSK